MRDDPATTRSPVLPLEGTAVSTTPSSDIRPTTAGLASDPANDPANDPARSPANGPTHSRVNAPANGPAPTARQGARP